MESIREFLVNLETIEVAIYSLCFLLLIIILMIIYLISFYIESEEHEKKQDQFNLEHATKALENMEKKPRQIIMDEYEKSQEENAIISYEELLEQTTKMPLIIESEIEKQEMYDEESAPISIDEFKEASVVVSDTEEDLSLTKEMAFLNDLKSFRANMK